MFIGGKLSPVFNFHYAKQYGILAVAAHLTGIHSAIKMLHSRIKVLHHYLQAMQKGIIVSLVQKWLISVFL